MPILLQFAERDYFIALMAARELQRAAPEGTELRVYDTGHDMRLPSIRADRRAFLGERARVRRSRRVAVRQSRRSGRDDLIAAAALGHLERDVGDLQQQADRRTRSGPRALQPAETVAVSGPLGASIDGGGKGRPDLLGHAARLVEVAPSRTTRNSSPP